MSPVGESRRVFKPNVRDLSWEQHTNLIAYVKAVCVCVFMQV